MEKLLRFKVNGGSEVSYPYSSFRGISTLSTDAGFASMKLSFTPQRLYGQATAAAGAFDFDTDTITIVLSDISDARANFGKALRNFQRAISANSDGVVDIIIIQDDAIKVNAFTSKREPWPYVCTDACGITWAQVVQINIATNV